VAVYCAYGFDIGRNVTKTLIERGFDARFVRGGRLGVVRLGRCARAQTDGAELKGHDDDLQRRLSSSGPLSQRPRDRAGRGRRDGPVPEGI